MNAVIEREAHPIAEAPQRVESNATALMRMIERAVVDPGFDVNKLTALIAVQERWEANQARKAFDAAIALAKAEIKPIVKRQEVDFTSQKGRTNYKYEGFADIAEHVDPILGKYGLSYRHRPKQDGKMLTITCILSHRDGHSEESSLSALNDESGNKNGIQGIGSTATFLQRYTVKLALGLAAAKDNDGRGYSDAGSSDQDDPGPKFITAKQVADLQAKIEEVGANKENFLKVLKVESLSEVHSNQYAGAIQRLNDKARGVR